MLWHSWSPNQGSDLDETALSFCVDGSTFTTLRKEKKTHNQCLVQHSTKCARYSLQFQILGRFIFLDFQKFSMIFLTLLKITLIWDPNIAKHLLYNTVSDRYLNSWCINNGTHNSRGLECYTFMVRFI